MSILATIITKSRLDVIFHLLKSRLGLPGCLSTVAKSVFPAHLALAAQTLGTRFGFR